MPIWNNVGIGRRAGYVSIDEGAIGGSYGEGYVTYYPGGGLDPVTVMQTNTMPEGVSINNGWQAEALNQLQNITISAARGLGNIPNDPPKKFFGATLVPEAKPAFMEFRDLIKEIGYTVIELGGAVPAFNIVEVRADYKGDRLIMNDSMVMFNDRVIVEDMQLEHMKRNLYTIPTQLNGNNQGGSVFQYGYVS